MTDRHPRKTVRSYRLVFRRRWRIFRIQGWRIPLPGGIELRLLAYWLAALLAVALLGQLPLLGLPVAALPASLRLLALPLAAAWLLSRTELDGRAPHRSALGLLRWRLRPRVIAALRAVPPAGETLTPISQLVLAPDLSASAYPAGRIDGPARLLLRYPLRVVRAHSAKRSRRARPWALVPLDAPPLHSARTLTVPAGRSIVFALKDR